MPKSPHCAMDDYRVPLRFRLTRPILRAAFRGVFHALAPVKIFGRENVPIGSPYVVAMNHVSIFDPPFIASFWPEKLRSIPVAVMGAPAESASGSNAPSDLPF